MKIIKCFVGDDVDTQRLIITEEDWETKMNVGNYVNVRQLNGRLGANGLTFTHEEGRFLLDALIKIYPPH